MSQIKIVFVLKKFQVKHAQLSSDMFFLPFLLISAFIQIYLFCHFGHGLSSGQEGIADDFYQLCWYRLSEQMQKLLLFPIMAAQNPSHLQAFGSIECTRGMFTKVLTFIFNC